MGGLARTKEEYTAVLELVKQIAKEEEKTREIVGKIRERHGHLDSVKMELDELDLQMQTQRDEIAEKTGEVNKAKIQGARRKAGREEEMEENKRAREEARQLLGEKHLAAVDLANQIRDVNLMEEEERDHMGQEAARIRANYASLLESIKKFNEKLDADFTKLEAAMDKINTPSAL